MDYRKTYYILPNLFTLGSVFCGFISISLAASGQGGAGLYQAALAICFGFFFDTADGRVARLTRTQTDLGRELDSLADVVTFGAAPAMLVYKWGLSSFGRAGIFIAGLYLCAGAMRLARFNVLSRREEEAGHHAPGKYTLGLSIPAAASVLVLMVIATQPLPYRGLSETFVAGVVLTLSYFMVSRIRFRSFKDLRFTRKTVGLFLLALGCGALVAMIGVTKALIFLVMITAYIVLGITESIIFMKRQFVEQRAARARAAQAQAAQGVEAEAEAAAEAAQQDEAVLRELGAFDAPDDETETGQRREGAPADERGAGALPPPVSSTSTKMP
ncbi:MAG TPA: CDP-diacylglycerol--serine O-phosphatidyltransferase [Polyangia bacterium]|nr:CDP-diacylglycerol--serine O-phosphatidyltransferase [Polyangia bacterium]